MLRVAQFIKPVQSFSLALLIVFWQLAIPLTIILGASSVANAAPVCVIDTAGANDEPGQKDLTKLCVDYAGVPTTVSTTWNWDDLGTNGANTLDACNLFDTDGDGNINYAVCVTTTGNPATLQTLTTYSCGDDKIDRCTSPASPVSSGSTSCTISQQNTDPFTAGNSAPKDTQGACTIQLSTVGGASAKLIDVCSYPSGQPNSDPSDCVIARDNSGKVELVKDLIPGTDSGLFNLTINGPGSNDTTTVNNVSDGGTTGEVVVGTGSVVVSEAPGTSTALTSYSTTVVCKNLNGTGTIVGQSSPTGTTSRQLTFTLADQADVVCTITNTRLAGTLILQKTVVNDNGGILTQSSFPVAISGTTAQWGSNTVAPGSYIVSETQQPGYSASVWGGDCDAQGNVSVADQQTKTCTITNNDIAPQVTVIKNVTNNNGGTSVSSDFTMNVAGTEVSDSSFPGVISPGTTVSLDAGAYNVTESGPAGYSGSFSADCTGTISIGETKVCTVTNDDNAPQLTIVKAVTNDNGGTLTAGDFILHLTGGIYSGSENMTSSTTPTVVSNTAYTLSEDGIFGYNQTSIGCTDDTTRNAVSHPVTLTPGQRVTCTITNNDIAPQLTVNKIVTNDDGGILTVSDFPLYVDNLQVTSGQTYEFAAGTYTVSETQQSGYTLDSILGNCLSDGSVTLVIGGVYSCTLTNNDQPAKIKVTKVVVNDNGGTAEISNFTLRVNSTQVVSGITNTFAANQSYAVSELAMVDGYNLDSIVCLDSVTNASLSATFTPVSGQEVNCTITNNDKQPGLTLTKVVIDESTNPANPNEWTLNADPETNNVGATTISGDGNPNDGGGVSNAAAYAGVEYTLSETNGPTGFSASGWVCSEGDLDGNVLTLALDEHATCTITNTKLAELTVTKDSVPNDAEDFSFTLSDQSPLIENSTSGTLNEAFNLDDDSDATLSNQEASTDLQPGTYYITEDQVNGWDLTAINCGDNVDFVRVNATTISVDLAPGDVINCTFTNTKRGQVTIVKDAQPNSIQPFTFTGNLTGDNGPNFDLIDDGVTPELASKTFENLVPGTYNAAEPNVIGWTLESITCTGGEDSEQDKENNRNAVINLAPGENVTCTFINTRDTGSIIVHKITEPSGSQQEFDINLRDFPVDTLAHNSSLADGESDTYDAVTGSYTLDEENIPAGWDLSDALCTREEGENQTDFDPRNGSFDINKDDVIDCTFTNQQRGLLTVTKYNDINQNGQRDEGEPALPGWDITLDETTRTTNALGSTVFDELKTDSYALSETMQAGWNFSDIDCGDIQGSLDGETFFFRLSPGDAINCEIGNYQDAVLIIEKTNNRPNPTTVGDTVTYTLTVKVPENAGKVFDTAVTDLPPENFDYVPGSWTARSSVRGDLKADGVTTEPTYGSPGGWPVGDLVAGAGVTLTYAPPIANSVLTGSYPDIAFAFGCESTETCASSSPTAVLANVSTGSSTPFVGTNVSIVTPAVLGASTTRLVNTGTELWRMSLIAGTIILVTIAMFAATRTRKGGQL